ncbi:hypothetical protein BZL54_22080 [Burkholderia ubonensis subsp. mesacidophila]|uniref:Uncharacterized protein n=1 Tax=Burkholderia ubonensis subsp. mesacidophila TaxID=265293 RepID=A0A2A4F8G5_9BURK|nr:hypothetical protein BZL54_22080 [Burkholderia ubonensis subsp. mesacidophila]
MRGSPGLVLAACKGEWLRRDRSRRGARSRLRQVEPIGVRDVRPCPLPLQRTVVLMQRKGACQTAASCAFIEIALDVAGTLARRPKQAAPASGKQILLTTFDSALCKIGTRTYPWHFCATLNRCPWNIDSSMNRPLATHSIARRHRMEIALINLGEAFPAPLNLGFKF